VATDGPVPVRMAERSAATRLRNRTRKHHGKVASTDESIIAERVRAKLCAVALGTGKTVYSSDGREAYVKRLPAGTSEAVMTLYMRSTRRWPQAGHAPCLGRAKGPRRRRSAKFVASTLKATCEFISTHFRSGYVRVATERRALPEQNRHLLV